MSSNRVYFVLRSRFNGHVMAVAKETVSDADLVMPGAVLTVARYQANDPAQEWTFDAPTHTLRPRANENLCVDMAGKLATVTVYQQGNALQEWGVGADRIHQRQQVDMVLEITDKKKQPGSNIECHEWNDGKNQIWTREEKGIQYFYLRSKMHGKVLDVKGADEDPGTKGIMYEQKCDQIVPNQLWYQDKHGVIHAKLNHMVLDFSDGKAIRLQPQNLNNTHQGFKFIDGVVARNKDFSEGVLDIIKKKTGNGAELCMYEYTGEPNQLWWRDYIN